MIKACYKINAINVKKSALEGLTLCFIAVLCIQDLLLIITKEKEMLAKEVKREVFDFFVCKKEPFEILYLKKSALMSWEQAEQTCLALSAVMSQDKNLCVSYDLTSNRYK